MMSSEGIRRRSLDPASSPAPARSSAILPHILDSSSLKWGCQRRFTLTGHRGAAGSQSPEIKFVGAPWENSGEKVPKQLFPAAEITPELDPRPPAPPQPSEAVEKRWTLRPRRSASRSLFDPSPGPSNYRAADFAGTEVAPPERISNPVKTKAAAPAARTSEHPDVDRAAAAAAKFSISLSKEEIDEDIYAVTGKLPRRRPRKRPRALQKQLDLIFPGGWLSEITADAYKVEEEEDR